MPCETPLYVPTGITRFNFTKFVFLFEFFLNTECEKQMNTATSMINTNQGKLSRVKETTLMANSYLRSLNMSDGWNVPSGHWMGYCYNCDVEDHTDQQCPNPCDKSRIGNSKKARNSGYGKVKQLQNKNGKWGIYKNKSDKKDNTDIGNSIGSFVQQRKNGSGCVSSIARSVYGMTPISMGFMTYGIEILVHFPSQVIINF